MFEYKRADDVLQNSEKDFKMSYFLVLADGVTGAITKRFDLITNFNNIFGFLYNIGKLRVVSDTEFFKCCQDLQIHLTDNETKDLNGCDLYKELLIFRHLVNENIPLLQVLFEVKKTNAFLNIRKF